MAQGTEKIYKIINEGPVRSGYSPDSQDADGLVQQLTGCENALAAEAAGVSALAMHGRTREQMYTGHADLERCTT